MRKTQPNGTTLREVFRNWGERSGVDEEFAAVVAEIRNNSATELDSDPWLD